MIESSINLIMTILVLKISDLHANETFEIDGCKKRKNQIVYKKNPIEPKDILKRLIRKVHMVTRSLRKDLADARSGVADSFGSFSIFLFIIFGG